MTWDPARRLGRNALFNLIRSAAALPVLLLLTPYIIARIGTEAFGIWALVGVVTSYAQLGDFGIGESLVKYVAGYAAKGDEDGLNRLFNTALAAYLVLALLLGGGLLLAMPVIAGDLLVIPARLLGEAVPVLRLAVAVFFANLVFGVFASFIAGAQRMELGTVVHLVALLLTVVGTVGSLENGWGLYGLVVTNAVAAAVSAGLQAVMAWRIFPGLRLGFRRWTDRQMLHQLFSFSWKVQLSTLSQLLVFQLDRILLSRYLGLEMVALYEVGNRAATCARAFVATLFTPVTPAASDIEARAETALLAGLYRRAFKFMVLIAVPFGLLVVALAQPLVALWMGPGFELAALTLQLLMPVYMVNVLTGPGYYILNGINRPDVGMRSALFAGAANLMLCTVLVQSHGYFGLIAGMMVSLVVSAVYFFVMLHRVLPGVDTTIYRATLLRPLIVALPAAALVWWGAAVLARGGAGAVAALAAGYLLTVGALLLRGDYLDEFERGVLARLFTPAGKA